MRKTQIEGPWTSQCTPQVPVCSAGHSVHSSRAVQESRRGHRETRGEDLTCPGRHAWSQAAPWAEAPHFFPNDGLRPKLSLWGKRQFHFQNSNKMGYVLTTKVTTPSMPCICVAKSVYLQSYCGSWDSSVTSKSCWEDKWEKKVGALFQSTLKEILLSSPQTLQPTGS